MAGLFVVVPLTAWLQLQQVFGCLSQSGHTGALLCRSGLMEEALGSDALRGGCSALLCHQDGLLPHLQDV